MNPARVGGGEEFDGPAPFVMGSVVGARSFCVTSKGELTGVVYPRIWTEGINLADCRAHAGWSIPGIGRVDHLVRRFVDDGPPVIVDGRQVQVRVHNGWTWYLTDERGNERSGMFRGTPTKVFLDWDDPAHDFADCTCGFYGYYKGSMTYATRPDVVNGVVEGYGLVRRGTRGFRAQKVRIRALYLPPMLIGPRRNYDVDKSLPMSRALGRAGELSRLPEGMGDLIAERYPNVPIFSSLDDMLAEFPTDPATEAA